MADFVTGTQIHEHSLKEFKDTFNDLYKRHEPFVFIIDFELKKPRIFTVDSPEILFDFDEQPTKSDVSIQPFPVPIEDYSKKFDVVMKHLSLGDSFLTNLTVRTKIKSDLSLFDLYQASTAPYKFLLRDSFLCFSPETFVTIAANGMIYSYPMKGTIDASIPDAKEKILADQKELAEHTTIVDLIRNDLSMIASDVKVTHFRYIHTINTATKTLLQVCSEITGRLLPSFHEDPAGGFLSLLPAGSISGAPKAKTVEIIKESEQEERGYYTGICGYYDGTSLQSGVMIRFIEQQGSDLYYRSGGGITTQSDMASEYKEVLDKIYVPTH